MEAKDESDTVEFNQKVQKCGEKSREIGEKSFWLQRGGKMVPLSRCRIPEERERGNRCPPSPP